MMHVPTSQWAKPCPNIRGLQLSQAGKTRLPRSSTNSFLLFAKGACKAPRPLSGIADLIPAQLSEIKPLKSQQMLARKGALCQWLILKYQVFFGMSIWTNSNRQITRPWRDIWWLKSTGWKWEDVYGSTPDPCAPPESWVWYSLSVYTYIIVQYSAYSILYLFVLNVMYSMFVWCEFNGPWCHASKTGAMMGEFNWFWFSDFSISLNHFSSDYTVVALCHL